MGAVFCPATFIEMDTLAACMPGVVAVMMRRGLDCTASRKFESSDAHRPKLDVPRMCTRQESDCRMLTG